MESACFPTPSKARYFTLLLLISKAAASHYDTLTVPADASMPQIKSAYHKAALRNHPDKTRKLGAARKASAAARMEQLNEAYATLSDPARRRDYDLSLRNPFHRSRYSSSSPPPQYAPPRVVKLTMDCTLEQFGGFASVEVPLHEAFGIPSGHHIPPMRVFLPPGSATGDFHRVQLPHLGAVLVLKLVCTTPHPVYSRQGDDLSMTVHLAAWHNRQWWRRGVRRLPLRVRSLSSAHEWHTVCPGDVLVPPKGKHFKLRGLGMPRAGAAAVGGSPYGCARGDLHVFIRLRPLPESSRRYSGAVAAALVCAPLLRHVVRVVLPRVGRVLLPRRRAKVPVLSMWTGPGPGISKPFRVWGKPGLYKYRMEYVD